MPASLYLVTSLQYQKLLKIFPIATEWSISENSCPSFWISKEGVKSSVEIIMSTKTFVGNTKHDSHDKVPNPQNRVIPEPTGS